MNQEQNNLNPNNFNTQGNNGISNNQPLQNNQGFNPTFNQNVAPNTNVSGPTFNTQPTVEPMQQPVMQEPASQPVNPVEIGNANNANFNSKPPKKMNLGLIIGIVAAVVVVISCIFLFSVIMNNIGSENSIENNIDSNLNNKNIITTDDIKMDMPEEVLLDFEKFYFEFAGIEFRRFDQFEKLLAFDPIDRYGDKIEDMEVDDFCQIIIEVLKKKAYFNIKFYDDGSDRKNGTLIMEDIQIGKGEPETIDFTFSQGVKSGDSPYDVVKIYGNPQSIHADPVTEEIYSITYWNEEDWFYLCLHFEDGKLNTFDISYDYEKYLTENK